MGPSVEINVRFLITCLNILLLWLMGLETPVRLMTKFSPPTHPSVQNITQNMTGYQGFQSQNLQSFEVEKALQNPNVRKSTGVSRRERLGLYIAINIRPMVNYYLWPGYISTLHNRRLQDIAILMYKVKNNMCSTYISTLFEQPAIKYKLCNHDFTIPRFNTVSFGKHSLRYMGPKVWSSVPSNVKKASTLSSFKYNIGKVDLSMLLDDNNCSNCSLCIS